MPAYETISSTTYATRATTPIAAPSGVVDGDLLLFFMLCGDASEADPQSPMTAGFTPLAGSWPIDVVAETFNVELYAYSKIASQEPASYTFVHVSSTTQAAIIRISDPGSASLIVTQNSGTGATATLLGVNPVNANALIVAYVNDWLDNVNARVPPSGSTPTFTERLDGDTSLMYLATGVHTVDTATGNKTMTVRNVSAGGWMSILIAVEPQTAPDAPTVVVGSGGYEQVGVQWVAGLDGGSDVTSWDIDHATAADPTTWLGPTNTADTVPYGTVTGLTNATGYVFRVRGVNAIGNGAWSTTSGTATPTDVRGFFLLEDGTSKFLLEDGTSKFLLESGSGVSSTPLLVDNATHGHTADNVALTQHQVLAVANATHAHTAANVALVQHYGPLTVADATHGHTAANVALTQHQVLAVASATHAHSAEAVTLTQHQVLAVAAATHGHSAANVALTQHFVLAVADATHGHSADNLSLAQVITLVVADATHAHSVEAVTLTQHQVLVVADATHAHSAELVVLTQHQVLVVADATHGHTAAAVVLTQHQVLVVANATHGHTAEAVVLAAHEPGATALDVHNATHAHTAANVALTQHNVLVVADTVHAHTAGNIALTQHQVLVVASATHGHTAENVTVGIGVVTLTVASTTHGHTAAAVALTQHHVLAVADTVHAHSVDAVALLQHQLLAVDDARHAHTGAMVMFFVGELTLLRMLHIRAEARTLIVDTEARTLTIRATSRTLVAPAEDRGLELAATNRRLFVEAP